MTPTISFTTEPELLIESEETIASLNFNLSEVASASETVITVNSANLSEFNLNSIQIEGGDLNLNSEIQSLLETTLSEKVTPEIPGVTIAVTTPLGNWSEAAGVANLENNTPLSPDDRFQIGSVTKTFTATTILKLVEAEIITLEDKITDWLPETVTANLPNSDEITIRQLLNHTSGIAEYDVILLEQAEQNPLIFLREWQPEEIVNLINGVEPFFAPGEGWQYSNTNYILAGMIIEAATDNNIAAEIRSRILEPLNLENTFFAEEEEIPGGYISGYLDFDGDGILDDISVANISWAWANGAMVSTTEDLTQFAKALYTGELLSETSLAEMFTVVDTDQDYSYGLGMMSFETADLGTVVGHRGGTLGFNANMWYSAEDDFTYVDLANGRANERLVDDIIPAFRSGVFPTVGNTISYNEFDFKITEQDAQMSLSVLNDGENEGEETATFTVEPGEGYEVNSNANLGTFTIVDSSELNSEVNVALGAFPTEVIEGEMFTLFFEIDNLPSEGVFVYVDSEIPQSLSQFDLTQATLNGGESLIINPDLSGFAVKLLTDDASISVPVVVDEVEEDPVSIAYEIQTRDEISSEDLSAIETVNQISDYTINPLMRGETVTVFDYFMTINPEFPTVSLITGPDFLVESQQTISTHVFNITQGTLPEEGLIVSVNAPNLNEFDLENIEIIDGEIIDVRADGFDLRLTDFTTLINLPISNDSETEGLEIANFTLGTGNNYQVNSNFSSGQFSLTDTIEEVPFNISEPNDTIPLASETGISPDNPQVTLSGSLDFEIGNRYQNEEGGFTYIDGTEDVDFYQVDLSAGDIIAFDIDAVIKGNPSITEFVRDRTQGNPILRLFDAEGNELAVRGLGQAAGELFATSTDPYLEFQAPTDGTYYLGVSVFTNGIPYRFGGGQFGDTQGYIDRSYDPFIPESGDGDSRGGFDYRGIGNYDLQITLNPENPVLLAPQQDRSNNSPPTEIDIPAPGEPTVSLDFVAGTYDPEDNLIDGNLVEGLPNQGSILTLVVQTEGEIPAEGILVTINSNSYLRDYATVRTLVSPPFSPGAELVDVVTDDTGRETGIQLRIFEPITFFPINARTQLRGELLDLETDGPEEVTFFLEGGEGYGVSATNNQITSTFYDSAEQAGTPEVIPEVGIAISETELIESEGTTASLNFSLSEPPPENGVLVYVKSDTEFVLSQFDIFNIEVSGGTFPFFNGDFSGFYYKITEQDAQINLSAFPDFNLEGIQDYNFTIQDAAGYTIDADAAEINFSIADNPNSVVEVSLTGEPEVLVESDHTASIHTFTLSATPPTAGVTVQVDAPNLSEFDLDAISVLGGEITAVSETSFDLNITETTATIELPVLADSDLEGLETATFTLTEGTDYLVNPETNQANFSLVDIPSQIPSPTAESGTNDTIPQAIPLNLNPDNPIPTRIIGDLSPREPDSDRTDYRDFSEDVDFYSFEVGDSLINEIVIDIDTVEYDIPRYEGTPQRLDSELRLFDAEGNELARVNSGAAPDEEFSRDPYLRYSIDQPGTYYIGISQLGNRDYDPFEARSGSGWLFPQVGVYAGEYELNVELIVGDSNGVTLIGTDTDETLEGNEGDDLVAGLLGDDTLFGNGGDDILRGDRNSRDPGGSVGGDDVISGGEGNDQIGGKAGNDLLSGDAGDDLIWGDDGNDTIMGVTGDDTLTGDDFSGGSGSDLFVFGNGDGTDTITDFDPTEDMIGLVEGELIFEDIEIIDIDGDAAISMMSTGETLAVLDGVAADELTAEMFMVTPDVSFG